jgi:hypothetical protein
MQKKKKPHCQTSGIGALLSSRLFTPVSGEVSSTPGLLLPALRIPEIKGDPAIPGRLRSMYRPELLFGGFHDMIPREVGAEDALLLLERKSNQCPPLC